MVMTIIFSLLFSFLAVFSLNSGFFLMPGRFSSLFESMMSSVRSLFSNVSMSISVFLTSLMITLLVINFSGNIPLMNIGTLYYYLSATVSCSMWLAVMVVVTKTQLYGFLAHMLPYGAPSALMLFLPIVELFSQIIRPLTLMIRLSTNLSAGHIMLFMFSYFSLASFLMGVVIFGFLGLLFILEMAISILQAYIFSSLLYLYICETTDS